MAFPARMGKLGVFGRDAAAVVAAEGLADRFFALTLHWSSWTAGDWLAGHRSIPAVGR
jgi:hypothetical protein